MKRVCPGCGKRITRQGEHDHRPSAHQRGYGKAWQALAHLAIQRQPYCTRCGSTRDLTVDHVDPSTKHKTLTLYDVQVLWRSCNATKGKRTDHDHQRDHQRHQHAHDDVEPLVA